MIDRLQRAIDKIRKLSGLLPICASCIKIRDDKGYWKESKTTSPSTRKPPSATAYVRDAPASSTRSCMPPKRGATGSGNRWGSISLKSTFYWKIPDHVTRTPSNDPTDPGHRGSAGRNRPAVGVAGGMPAQGEPADGAVAGFLSRRSHHTGPGLCR